MVKYKAGSNTRKEPGAGGGSNRTKKQIAADDMAMAIGKKIQGAIGGRTISDQDIRLIKNALSLDKKKYGGKTKKAKGMAKGGKTRMAMKSKGYAKGGKTKGSTRGGAMALASIRAAAKKKGYKLVKA